jgi:hypothetical protein
VGSRRRVPPTNAADACTAQRAGTIARARRSHVMLRAVAWVGGCGAGCSEGCASAALQCLFVIGNARPLHATCTVCRATRACCTPCRRSSDGVSAPQRGAAVGAAAFDRSRRFVLLNCADKALRIVAYPLVADNDGAGGSSP